MIALIKGNRLFFFCFFISLFISCYFNFWIVAESHNSNSDELSQDSDEAGNEKEKTTNDADSLSDFMKDSDKESNWDSDEHQDWSGKKTTNGYVRKKKRIK